MNQIFDIDSAANDPNEIERFEARKGQPRRITLALQTGLESFGAGDRLVINGVAYKGRIDTPDNNALTFLLEEAE